MRSEGDSDKVTTIIRITCASARGGKKDLQTVRHNTLKKYARRCEWKCKCTYRGHDIGP